MPQLGFDLPTTAIDALFDEYDPDKSGVMDFKELQRMLRPTPKGLAKMAGEVKKTNADEKKPEKGSAFLKVIEQAQSKGK